jgi:DNA-directed RNA polymerase subunit RPC12/RpoP
VPTTRRGASHKIVGSLDAISEDAEAPTTMRGASPEVEGSVPAIQSVNVALSQDRLQQSSSDATANGTAMETGSDDEVPPTLGAASREIEGPLAAIESGHIAATLDIRTQPGLSGAAVDMTAIESGSGAVAPATRREAFLELRSSYLATQIGPVAEIPDRGSQPPPSGATAGRTAIVTRTEPKAAGGRSLRFEQSLPAIERLYSTKNDPIAASQNRHSQPSSSKPALEGPPQTTGTPMQDNAAGQGNRVSSPSAIQRAYPYVCSTCNKIFARRYELATHSNVHSGTKYTCPYPGCGSAYTSKSALSRHEAQKGHVMTPRRHQSAGVASTSDEMPLISGKYVTRRRWGPGSKRIPC